MKNILHITKSALLKNKTIYSINIFLKIIRKNINVIKNLEQKKIIKFYYAIINLLVNNSFNFLALIFINKKNIILSNNYLLSAYMINKILLSQQVLNDVHISLNGPKPEKSLVAIKKILSKLQNYTDTNKSLKKSIKFNPINPISYFLMGKNHFYNHNYKQAIFFFKKALSCSLININNYQLEKLDLISMIYVEISKSLLKMNKYDEAYINLNIAKLFNPFNGDINLLFLLLSKLTNDKKLYLENLDQNLLNKSSPKQIFKINNNLNKIYEWHVLNLEL